MSQNGPSSLRPRAGLIACALLLIVYTALAFSAVSTKSPTFDEPLHTLASYVAVHDRDFRLDYDNPPLWKYWAGLANLRANVRINTTDPQWLAIPRDLFQQWVFTLRTLYRDPANDPDRLIQHSRTMMLIIAIGLGIVIARWAWYFAGATAAISATFLFAFDPNFLAHGPLVKNDVVLALLLTAMAYAVARLGEKITESRALIVGAICGAGCTVKFSGVLLPILASALIVFRAVLPGDWGYRAYRLRRPISRFAAAASLVLVIAATSYLVIWLAYGFRFSVTPDPALSINTRRILATLARNQTASPSAMQAWTPTPSVKLILWTLQNHLLPEGWLNGLLFIDAGRLRRPSFLLGSYRDTGWWAYYPVAVAVKTPLATLSAIAIAACLLLRLSVRRTLSIRSWSIACLVLPPLIYSLLAASTPANAGIRHLLPIFPFLYIACGLAATYFWRARLGRWLIAAIAIALMTETLSAYPDYLAFFNIAAGGERGGIRFLGDSNLDWGQDLPLLARWQQDHPDLQLYLCYFGTADPRHYGIRYISLPGGYVLDPPPRTPTAPGVIAISTTVLQGIYSSTDSDTRAFYAPLRNRQPIDCLGGSIYLYDFSPKSPVR